MYIQQIEITEDDLRRRIYSLSPSLKMLVRPLTTAITNHRMSSNQLYNFYQPDQDRNFQYHGLHSKLVEINYTGWLRAIFATKLNTHFDGVAKEIIKLMDEILSEIGKIDINTDGYAVTEGIVDSSIELKEITEFVLGDKRMQSIKKIDITQISSSSNDEVILKRILKSHLGIVMEELSQYPILFELVQNLRSQILKNPEFRISSIKNSLEVLINKLNDAERQSENSEKAKNIYRSKLLIYDLKENVLKNISDSIKREITFSPEHYSSGSQMLSYYRKFLRDKDEGAQVRVSLEQIGLSIKLVITASDKETLDFAESTLNEYGMILTGRIPPERAFINNIVAAQDLKTKLELAQMELRLTKENHRALTTAQGEQMQSLQEEMTFLKQVISEDMFLRYVSEIRQIAQANRSISNEINIVIDKIKIAGASLPTETDKEEILAAIESIRQKEPGMFSSLVNLFNQYGISIGANFITEFLKNI